MSRSILVVGGGIAGLEAALTLARGLPADNVTLVGRWPALRLAPDLVHVPFGVSLRRLDVPLLPALESHGVRMVIGECTGVDLASRIATCGNTQLPYDVLVAAPGVVESAGAAGVASIRNAAGALGLRDRLEDLRLHAHHRPHSRFVVRVVDGVTWSPPGVELALLARTWFDRVAPSIDVTLACADFRPLDLLGEAAATAIEQLVDEAGIELLTGVPAGRFDSLDGDLVVELRPLEANRIAGLGPLLPSGFYPTDRDGRLADDVFVVGDASASPWKSGFSAAWQARRLLAALGGDPEVLGRELDGVPAGCWEYQLDAGTRTLIVRGRSAAHLDASMLSARATTTIITDPAAKLRGTMLRRLLLANAPTDASSVQFRRLLQAERPVGRQAC